MQPEKDSWHVYRGRMRAARWVLVAGIPVGIAAALLWSVMSLAIVVVWALVMAGGVSYAELSPCPQCGKAFFRAGAYHNSFAKACLNCGLAKWSTPGNSDSASDGV